MKKNLKKYGKWLIKILLIILLICFLFLIYSRVNHQIHSKKEKKYLKNYDLGEIIEIEDLKINYKIFNPQKEKIIVMMGGSGANDLSLSLEPLAKNIDAQIILINRPGYGLSSDTNKPAKIEYIVSLYRKVLQKLNITKSVILMPHSISGMYAMYWTKEYPEEIDKIINLDIGSPNIYLKEESNKISTLDYIATRLGLHRFIYDINGDNTAIQNYNVYEKDTFKAIWYMNILNPLSKFNISEEKLIKENAKKVVNNNKKVKEKKKLYIETDNYSGNFYELYEHKKLLKYYQSEEEIKKIKKASEKRKEEERKDLIDELTIYQKVEGPHCIYYYPTQELIEAINDFIKE